MPSARRCEPCRLNWPINPDFNPCPVCQKPTEIEVGTTPMGITKARKLDVDSRFERFYQEREEERVKRGELPPEILGRIEAREEIKNS